LELSVAFAKASNAALVSSGIRSVIVGIARRSVNACNCSPMQGNVNIAQHLAGGT
jgi:hypothetical protein